MTRRTLGGLGAAVVVALALVGFVASPARAAQAPAIAITSPSSGAVLTGPTPVTGQATMSGGRVLSVTLRVLTVGGQTVDTQSYTNDDDTLDFTWTPVIPANGNYTVAVEAWGRENIDFNGDESSTASRAFTMEAPPAAPANVKAVVDQVERTVTITWAANSEPDLIGYGVYRKQGGKFFERKIVEAGKPTTYTDQIGTLPAGTYEYQVVAARKNAAGACCVGSAASTTTAKVTSSPPPPPTTTTQPGSTGGSTATTVTTTKGPTVATRGRNDLSGFAALLPNGGAQLPSAPRAPRAEGLDPGFEQDLPFQSPDQAEQEVSAGDDEPVQALGGRSVVSSGDDERPTSLLFMAGGLLVTVVLMHLLWLRDEVNKGLLPAVEPTESAEAAES